jgi:DNA-binding transcriptional LysR family regulator
MLDRITGLHVFARVAALGSLSAAARAMGMSQTMATKHMAAVENRLGTKLLHRTTRRLTLTECGRSYLDAVERILADLDEADAAATVEVVEVRGTLRLNAPVSFGIREIAPLLPELARRNPALTIELGFNDRQVDLIEEGWDLVVRIGNMKDSSMIARRLADCPTVVCAAPSYLKSRGTPRIVADLAAHNCLGYTLSQMVGPNSWSFGRAGKVKIAVKGTLRANNGDALVAAAVAGLGIIYPPTFLVVSEIAAGTLVPLKLDHEPMALDGIFAAYPANRRPPAKVRATIDFLAEKFGQTPPWERRHESTLRARKNG